MTASKDIYYGDPAKRPPRPAFHGRNVPESIRAMPRWIGWRFAWKRQDEKWSKIPVDPHQACRKAAKTNDPATWADYAAALAAINAAAKSDPGAADGLGFVFHGDGLFGLDIDGCRDPVTGEVSPFARRLIDQFATYTEVSPSGMGVKLLGRGSMPAGWKGKKKKPKGIAEEIEVYDRGRYFTVTGQALDGSPADLADCGVALAAFLAEFWPAELTTAAKSAAPRPAGPLTDSEVIDKITRTAKNAGDGRRLWRGDTSGHGGDDSAADLALCNLIAFYAGPDPARIDGIFRRSGLMRPKWNRPDYSAATIAKALEGKTEFYDPDRPPPAAAKPATGSTPPRFALTDMGNAKRLVARHGRDLRYSHQQDLWYVWSGSRWEPDDTGEIQRRAKHTATAIFEEAAAGETAAEKQAIGQHAVRSQAARAISNMIQLARSEPGIPVCPDDLDADPWLFNCPNGTVDLRTGELRPHRRDDGITQMGPVEYHADAPCPIWEGFLGKVFPADPKDPAAGGHAGLIGYIQRLLGYGLTGDIREHTLPIFWGAGSNGKSTLIETAAAIFGTNFWAAAPDGMLMVRRSESHPTELARLYRKRMVAATETEEGQRLNATLVKRLTGGDTITARFMREDFFEFRPTHKLLICTNDRPRIPSGGHAIWRRVNLVEFCVKFWKPGGNEIGSDYLKADLTLPDRLRAELPGIFAWMVRGCLDWLAGGLAPPKEVQAATDKYRGQQNTVGGFIEERYERTNTAGAETPLKDLYAAYCRWAEENGETPFGKIRFNEAVEREGIVRDRNGANKDVWVGLVSRTTGVQEASREPKSLADYVDE